MANRRRFFNENDRFAAAWLRNLYTDAHVDERSIADVQPADLAGYRRCHFFGGIGGWELALQLAGWPEEEEVWTGSCPCQPYSYAGRRKGNADERNLWPEFLRLIRARRPRTIFGEQVASAEVVGKVGKRSAKQTEPVWLDGVFADMEAEGYTCGATVLGAHSVNAPHIRQRVFWVSVASGERRHGEHAHLLPWGSRQGNAEIARRGKTGGLSNAGHIGTRCGHVDTGKLEATERSKSSQHASADSMDGRLSDATRVIGECGINQSQRGSEGRIVNRGIGATGDRHWSNYEIIQFGDGKSRRIEPGIKPMAHGVSNRVGRLRGYGNAIVPQVAAQFIMAYMEVCSATYIVDEQPDSGKPGIPRNLHAARV